MHHLLTGRDPTKVQPLWQYPPVHHLNPRVSEATARIVPGAAKRSNPPLPKRSSNEMGCGACWGGALHLAAPLPSGSFVALLRVYLPAQWGAQ